jgi:HEAT repeat protein
MEAGLEEEGSMTRERIRQILAAATRDPDPAVQLAGVRGLLRLGEPRGPEAWLEYVTSAPELDAFERDERLFEALTAVVDFPFPEAQATLADFLRPPYALPDGLLMSIGSALGKIRHPQTFDLLIELLDHGSPYVAGAAATALGELGDRRAVMALVALADERHGEWFYPCTQALLALGNLGGETAFAYLTRSLQDSDVRETALEALAVLAQAHALPNTDLSPPTTI